MNPELQTVIAELRRQSHSQAALWRRVAVDLAKSGSNRRVVNLSRINRYTKENDTVIVPGKVLAAGALDHPVKVAAFSFSRSAKEMIERQKGAAISIAELLKENPKAKNVRIIG